MITADTQASSNPRVLCIVHGLQILSVDICCEFGPRVSSAHQLTASSLSWMEYVCIVLQLQDTSDEMGGW